MSTKDTRDKLLTAADDFLNQLYEQYSLVDLDGTWRESARNRFHDWFDANKDSFIAGIMLGFDIQRGLSNVQAYEASRLIVMFYISELLAGKY